ncbi:MAG TPA: hypothetical protein VLN59_17230 [Burkholderiales bacterium]|nr:hypothetical protein [Burkholderiales bacterium]
MEEPMLTALAGILDDYEARRNREVSARKAEQDSQEKFLADATAALDTIVAPCFEAFSRELKRHGHVCTIAVEKQDDHDKRSEVKITLTIFPNGTTLPQGNPSLSYAASSHRKKLSAHRSITTRNGGFIPSTIGEYELTQLTPALIDRDLLELAQSIFAAA